MAAQDAFDSGLVAEVHAPGSVLEAAVAAAALLARKSPTAVSLAKEAISRCKPPLDRHYQRVSLGFDGMQFALRFYSWYWY